MAVADVAGLVLLGGKTAREGDEDTVRGKGKGSLHLVSC
jgi:hypothetical protein